MAEEKPGKQLTENQQANTHQEGPVRAMPSQPVEYLLYESNRWEKKDAEVITETPVSLTVNGDVWLTFMCTPIDLEALALGFLFNEGVLTSMESVVQVHVCAAGDNVDVWLNHAAEKPDKWRRTSGCTGGVTSVETDHLPFELPAHFSHNGVQYTPAQVTDWIETLFKYQDLYKRSGGVHTSILIAGREVLTVGEDIGRHNTLDKLAGRCLLENIPSNGRIVITTGRISSEMIQKAARLGAAIVVSRTSPSSLSVRLAERWGLTLIGYARRNRFIVYTHPERIQIEP